MIKSGGLEPSVFFKLLVVMGVLGSGLKYLFISRHMHPLSTVQFSSVTQSCPTLCDPMNCSMPGFPVHHQIPELTQTYVCQVGDAIQPSHPLSSPSPPTFNLSQHQGLSNESVLGPNLSHDRLNRPH